MLDKLINAAPLIAEIPVEEALRDAESRKCRDHHKVFRVQSMECEKRGEIEHGHAWSLLQELMDMMFYPEDRSHPFKPVIEGLGCRSIIPSDLCGEPAKAICSFALQVEDPDLKARLLDTVWEANRTHAAADAAIPAYLESARNLFDPDNWHPCAYRYERALSLATSLRREELRKSIIAELEEVVVTLDGQDPMFLTVKLVSLLLEAKSSDVQMLAAISDKAAANAIESYGFDQAKRHLENLVICCRRLGDPEGEQQAKARIAKSFEIQGTAYADSGEHLAAAHWLMEAHNGYREAGMRERSDEIYASLRYSQQQAVDSMHEAMTDPIDLTEAIKDAKTVVSGYDLDSALSRLFSIAEPIDFDQVQQIAVEQIEEFVWIRLASGVVMDRDGRVVAPNADASDGEAAVWQQTVQLASVEMQYTGLATIQPAMEQIASEHSPAPHTLHEIARRSPFVSPGREELFVKGLLDGLRGDMEHALSLLVPQFENGLRYLLSTEGVQISSMDKDGKQDLHTMGRILSSGRLGEIMGSQDVVKEMKVLFTDDHGMKLRDRLSHGITLSEEFHGGGAYYAWWLVCRLCFGPVLVPPED